MKIILFLLVGVLINTVSSKACSQTECFETIGNILVKYDQSCGIKLVEIPANVEVIAQGVFKEMGIERAILNDRVREIGDEAFKGNLLKNIYLPQSVKVIGFLAFANNLIQSVDFPTDMIGIGERAFGGNKITSVVLPVNLKNWGGFIFEGQQLSIIVVRNPDHFLGFRESFFLETSFMFCDCTPGRKNMLTLVLPVSIKSKLLGKNDEEVRKLAIRFAGLQNVDKLNLIYL